MSGTLRDTLCGILLCPLTWIHCAFAVFLDTFMLAPTLLPHLTPIINDVGSAYPWQLSQGPEHSPWNTVDTQ